jgi:hypothetical protein
MGTTFRRKKRSWRLLWRRKSGRPVGRPPADADLRTMIRRLWTENPLWGEDRIAGELRKLGYKASPRTVTKYRPPHLPRNRGQSWPTFIRNHLHQTWACDFLTIVTLRFQSLYCFVIVDLARREIVHIGVTPLRPTAATQLVQGARHAIRLSATCSRAFARQIPAYFGPRVALPSLRRDQFSQPFSEHSVVDRHYCGERRLGARHGRSVSQQTGR